MEQANISQELVEKITSHPKYNDLVSKRTKFAWILSIIMLTIYYGFILLLAFAPQVLAAKISATSVISVGIPVGVFIILSAFLLTGIYVYRANGEFDNISNEIKESIK